MRSANSARPFLKPLVETFAMLFAVTSSLVCWASIPEAAVASERNMSVSLLGGAELARRAALDVVVVLDHPHQRLVGAGDLHEVDDAAHDVDVGRLEHPG